MIPVYRDEISPFQLGQISPYDYMWKLNLVPAKVLGKLPPRKIALPTDPKTNPNPNAKPNQGEIFLGSNCLVAAQP